MENSSSSDDVVAKFESDLILKPFIQEDFGVQSYTTQVIQSAVISQRLAQLVDGISVLDKELQTQIASRREDLLAQATGIESLEGVLNMMQTRILSLQSAVDRIRGKVSEPYQKILTRTAQLGRLQAACDLLRRIIRILYLSKRLQSQVQGGIREITKAAQSLNELDYLSQGVNLAGVDIIEGDLLFMKRARSEIESQASRLLEQGVLAQNPSQIATALQAFYNLGDLHSPLRRTIDDIVSNLKKKTIAALDIKAITAALNSNSRSMTGSGPGSAPIKGPGKAAGMLNPGDTSAFRTHLWNNIEELMESVNSAANQIVNLQKVLSKKRDPVTHNRFIDELEKNGKSTQFARIFWQNISHVLDSELKNAAKSSSFIQQAFEGEYPKLIRFYNNLWIRVQPLRGALEGKADAFNDPSSFSIQDIEIVNPVKTTEVNFNAEIAIKQSLQPFQTAYLQRSLSRLFDPVNLIFPQGAKNPPSDEEVDSIIKTIVSEISVSSVDAILSTTVAKNVAKTVKFFAVKSEQLLSTQGDATQVIAPPNSYQRCNANVVNSLYRLQESLLKVFVEQPDYTTEAIEIIQESLQNIVNLMANAIRPLLSSVADSVEAIILTIHNEDFSGDANETGDNVLCSLYMKELQDFIGRVVKDHFSIFKCKDFLYESLIPLGQRAISLFVRHASLVRPLGEAGKVILAADFAQMELAVTPLCHRLSEFGAEYRVLRALRPMLFQSNDAVVNSTSVGEVIPHSTVIHFLFSRAPRDFQSPHHVMEWSISRYSRWMDEHTSEKERLNMLRGTVENYVSAVRSKHGTEFAPVYPYMLGLLQKGMDKCA